MLSFRINMPTPSTLVAVVIPAVGDIRHIPLTPAVESLQAAVHGELVELPSNTGWRAYGAAGTGRPLNTRAAVLLGTQAGHDLSEEIYGDVVLVGIDRNGDIDDVPALLSETIARVLAHRA